MSSREDIERIEPFSTVTHARLRLRQGDTTGAKRILDTILSRDPDHPEARELVKELRSRKRAGTIRSSAESADTGAQTRRFRKALGRDEDRRHVIERLEDWLRQITRDTGDAHA